MSSEAVMTSLSHPVRARVLSLLEQQEASPKELSEILDEKIGNISYHVRTLHTAGLIELTRTEPRRGALEHFYRAEDASGRTINLELALNADGWAAVDDAMNKLSRRLAKLQKDNPGGTGGRVVGLRAGI